jgi:hypothetical protein
MTIDRHRIAVRSARTLGDSRAAQAYEALAKTRVAVTPPTAMTDAAFGTPFTRLTDPRHQDSSGDDDDGANFQGQKRKNDTHANTSDLDSSPSLPLPQGRRCCVNACAHQGNTSG